MTPRQYSRLNESLRKIARSLPSGGRLVYRLEPDYLWLEIFHLPVSARGTGTQWMSKILEAADVAQTVVNLCADPTDRPGDPSTYDLTRWYARFGFKPLAATEDGVLMERQSATPRPASEIEKAARAAKSADMSQEDFRCLTETMRQEGDERYRSQSAAPAQENSVPPPHLFFHARRGFS